MASAFSFLRGLLAGLMQKLGFANKEATVVLMGLDNAGKTTLQYKLKTGEFQEFVPTQRANEETFSVGGLTLKAWDLGGHTSARYMWKRYSAMADAIVFMIDGCDTDRVDEAKEELHGIIDDPEMAAIPLVVMANKCDMKHFIGREQLVKALDIDENVKLFPTSVLKEIGYVEAFRWLAERIP